MQPGATRSCRTQQLPVTSSSSGANFFFFFPYFSELLTHCFLLSYVFFIYFNFVLSCFFLFDIIYHCVLELFFIAALCYSIFLINFCFVRFPPFFNALHILICHFLGVLMFFFLSFFLALVIFWVLLSR